jgi:hypothetical protein
MFSLQRKSAAASIGNGQPDTSFEFLLNACNSKLSTWWLVWEQAMKKGACAPKAGYTSLARGCTDTAFPFYSE